MKEIRWCAIGDSFTYLNDHLDETGYRVSKGYLTRILEKVPGLRLDNIGINGSTLLDWASQPIPEADLYTVLLGTNDWHHEVPAGSKADFRARTAGTILGSLGILLDHIREAAPGARIIAGNPVERADFVYLWDPENNARGSYVPENGVTLAGLSEAILDCCASEGIATVDCHGRSGFTQENLVRFKRVRRGGVTEDLPYPDYIGIPFSPGEDPYPYPAEAAWMTYDGLHPTDEGNEILAGLFAEKIREVLAAGREKGD
jgi:lysophospholipase L1-like esterase